MDFFNYHNATEPKKGDLLISEPFLPDPNFERTVVLICEHSEDGTFGFVLNRESVLKMEDALDCVEGFEEVLHLGGPVQQNTLHFLHRRQDIFEEANHIAEDIFWGGNYEQLITLINAQVIDPKDFKFFLGYSGWSAGQLEDELKENSWIICPNATSKQIFDTAPEKLWKDTLQQLGGKYKVISNYPTDPRLN